MKPAQGRAEIIKASQLSTIRGDARKSTTEPQISLFKQNEIRPVTDPRAAPFALLDPTDRVNLASDLAAGTARVADPYDD